MPSNNRTPVEENWNDPVAAAYRRWGYLAAGVDPLERLTPLVPPDLEEARASADSAARERFEALYCGALGAEFMHLLDRERARWVATRLEAEELEADQERIFHRLLEAEVFEQFLHSRYVGSKRYSLEGMASLVPLLDSILSSAAEDGVTTALIAMSHRGRINVMNTVVGVDPVEIFTGMEDIDPRSVLGSGDVRYHHGATGQYKTSGGTQLAVHLVSNPSHLEAVDPVLLGRARARQRRLGVDGRSKVLAVCIHGDAAFAGQGIAAESLNMAGLPGYDVGGTVHILVNNLVGFTTQPRDLHSSRYSSDLMKRSQSPIFHVNAERPDAVVRAGALAAAYRDEFGSDVLVDLIGYRRHGHSEVEDPTTSQPRLYEKIEALTRLYESYGDEIGVGEEQRQRLEEELRARLDQAHEEGRARETTPQLRKLPEYWSRFRGGHEPPEQRLGTAVEAAEIQAAADAITRVPEGFALHSKVSGLFERRREMARGERPVDWATAELLALCTLRDEGIPIRMSGQDVRRGTFNQRHAVVVDTQTGEEHIPLAAGTASFEIYDSPLSEAAPVGFEYGYSRDFPEALVIWEAQFGDFVNGAQVIIDQFLAAGEDKWDLLSGLVLLLPHGYEGQGPEHSSARLERFLQLAAENNLQICQPTTSAQHFHLLRRQALQSWRKPLIEFTPKGLLRSPLAASPLSEFTDGRFHPVLDDEEIQDARQLLICTGRVAHDLLETRAERQIEDVAILRLAQLYPFPEAELSRALKRHPQAETITWIQEEPANTGALFFVRPRIQKLLGDRHLRTIKRSESASPATGSAKAHALEQKALLELAFA